ncbi:MAG TPA: TonB-dependent receptor [Acidobacteriaceae bacterium]|nr:TonB-dependent receptor [Acidobacteriaceae bacterium]
MAVVAVCLGISGTAVAQVGTASAALNGTIRDASGAVVPDATIALKNTKTGFVQITKSNHTGNYSLVNISPGSYTAMASRTGFSKDQSPEFELSVNQTATINFSLQIGSVNSTVRVSAGAVQIETSTAELGTVIGSTEVNALPLNGRNFTELLLLSPGISPVNATENSGFGGIGNPIGTVVLPSVNGQNNRSNMFLLDGVNDYGSIRDTYAVQPTLDDIEEFKVQSHNDEAQFGQVLGGIVNVVTKSGTNQFHGDAWEFLRNDALDAANYFNPVKTPLKQNQFGGGVGGPVILPHYNGHDKTFFYASYEGFRNNTASSNFYRTPTTAQLGGDFSNLEAQGTQLYNPFSSVPQSPAEPPNATGFNLQPFMCGTNGAPLPAPNNIQPQGTPCDKIPSSMIDPTMVNYAKTFFPTPQTITNQPQFNGLDTTPNITHQNQVSVRIDEQLNTTNRFFVRWTSAWEPITGSNGYPGAVSVIDNSNYNIAANWSHTFGSSSVLQLTLGRVSAQNNRTPYFKNTPSNYEQQSGFAAYLYNHAPFGGIQVPSVVVSNYLGAENYIGKLHYSNIWEYRGDFSKTIGRHSLRTGASLATDGWEQPFYGSENDFAQSQTQDGNLDSNTGDGMASLILGVPGYSEVDNVYSLLYGGKIIGAYIQDQWRATDKLTINVGLRYDLTVNPRQGKASNQSNITGDFDFSNGGYILQNSAPTCSPTQGAPCIPGGGLPAHVTIAKNGKIIHDNYDNFQPRIGFAYLFKPKTVIHGGYGRFFDNWAGVTENQSNYTQAWPNIAFVGAPGGFNLYGPPTGLAQDPFDFGNVSAKGIPPAPSPFSPLNTNFYTDPNLKNGYSDQWNFGFQQELAPGAIASLNYVGSRNARIATAITANASTSPGGASPYPYIPPTPYTQSLSSTDYNSLQVSSQIRLHSGISSTIAYTWSKSLTIGCDGFNSGCEIQNPYNLKMDRGPAAFDLPQIFTSSVVFPLPFGGGTRFSADSSLVNHIIGDWQLNGILSLNSGPRYDVQDDNGISNINNFYGVERADVVGNPRESTSAYPLNKTHPININAFVDPGPGTFGNMGRNSLRADWGRNLDLSLFRSFKLSDTKRFEFRAEAFNSTNTPVFGAPDNYLPDGPGYFGVVSSTANTARQMQLALKFYF